jgi:predicted naringenin-chalcone synthase
MVTPTVAGVAHAVPPACGQRDLWDGFFRAHYRADPRAERVWRASGVRMRHGVAIPPDVDVSGWGTGARMARYGEEAPALGKDAVAGALDAAGLAADEIGLFAVASCTGYVTPGLDILLARDLGMPASVRRLLIGHMGCYAALPGLGAAADYARAQGRPAVLLCVELPSLHVQPASPDRADLGQVVAHALFSDAAAAVVVTPGGAGLELADLVAVTDTTGSGYMTWDVTDHGFRMGLSRRVPGVLARHVHHVVTGMLSRHGLRPGDVAGWAVHPGGPRILDVVADRLGLPDDALAPSRAVLSDYGNCSSATALLLLERLRPSLPPDGYVVTLAFGPGLTLYAALLRSTG